jgi:glutamine amidotransferase/cyclase
MMQTLDQKGMVEPLRQYLLADRPFLGICLGLQALFEGSDESPGVPGLGLLRGRVRRFQTDLSVPHIGWNGWVPHRASRLFAGLCGEEKVYFVHSYHVVPEDESVVLTTTDYGQRFVSAIEWGQRVATQFHPEKSGAVGLRMLQNFLQGRATPIRPTAVRARTALAKRLIACLDVRANDQGDLVVTKGDQYDVREQGSVRNLGKPVELARRYYQQGADEITFLNITGFRHFPLEDMPMLEVLKQTSRDVFVPLTIGGGIRDYTDQNGQKYTALQVASRYFRSGADKVSIGSDAVQAVGHYLTTGQASGQSPIETIARVYGSQAVVVSIDPRRVYVPRPAELPQTVVETALPGPNGERFCWYQCTTQGGRQGSEVDAITLARVCEKLGAGEILLNSIDHDGQSEGFDLELVAAVKRAVTIPVIASSGAGRPEHFSEVFLRTGCDAALAAGIFHREEVTISAVKEHLRGRVEVRDS